jgi:gluconate 5-dehydrogenase
MNRFDLSGKLAFVTGSYRGLGFAIAQGLGQHGARVVLNGRSAQGVTDAVAKLKQAGIAASGYAFDVTDEAAVVAHVTRIEAEVGPIDILVNNAGVNHRHLMADFKTEDYRAILATNLDSVFFLCRETGRHMIARGRGKIINLGSISGHIARKKIVPYCASKGAVHQMTRGLAVEWAPHNIQVNAIAPGFIQTEMMEDLRSDREFTAWSESRIPAGHWGRPEDLIGAAVFLASPAANYVTGHVLFVDGGWTASF